jgi:hypothetical protein
MHDEQHEPVNEGQHLYFELLQRVRYNLLDGTLVVHDLLDWRDLWYSVIAIRLPLLAQLDDGPHAELALLRTTRWNQWPVDTLYTWTTDEKITQLQLQIEERWQPGEIEVLTPDMIDLHRANLRDPKDRVLSVWWD